METPRLFEVDLALAGRAKRIARRRGLGEEAVRIEVGAGDPVTPHDVVGLRLAEPQRQLFVTPLARREAIDHRPFVQAEAAHVRGTSEGLAQEAHDEVEHSTPSLDEPIDIKPLDAVIGAVAGPLRALAAVDTGEADARTGMPPPQLRWLVVVVLEEEVLDGMARSRPAAGEVTSCERVDPLGVRGRSCLPVVRRQDGRMHGSRVVRYVALAAALAVAGCSASPTSEPDPTSVPATTSATTSTSDPGAPLYLALGDSLAAGYQPRRGDDLETAYPARVTAGLAEQAPGLRLVNLACSGERVAQMLDGGQCRYPEGNQVAAAEKVLAERTGPVDLVTLNIGGNDLLRCAWPTIDQECARRGAEQVERRLPQILQRVGKAAGTDADLVVLTYYNPFLAVDDEGSPTALATASIPMIKRLNDAITDAAKANGWHVVRMESVIPDEEAVCESTWRCAVGDIHLTDSGARLVGDAIVRDVTQRSSR